MSVLQKLTEGIVNRNLQKDGQALLDKWERTGLLEGLTNERQKNNMASLLENQAKELLREASAMSAGDVEGFAAVAFPIVRRVFGGLVANDLVSVQPMSLPSGLIFFLDFVHGDTKPGAGATAGSTSVYGGSAVAKGIQSGVGTLDDTGYYDLSSGYASPTGSSSAVGVEFNATPVIDSKLVSALSESEKKTLRFDPDILADTAKRVSVLDSDGDATTVLSNLNLDNLTAVDWTGTNSTDGNAIDLEGDTDARLVRRLTDIVSDKLRIVILHTDDLDLDDSNDLLPLVYPLADNFSAGDDGQIAGATPWGLESVLDGDDIGLNSSANASIPEIDIKVDSIGVTAVTKKLKAKWTPELGQDLNAYHNLDAEVELTGILSEQVALEIDQEILNDLVQGATAGTLYWSRRPGQFLDPEAGTSITSSTAPPDFTGTVSEWYETLVETINDVSARIHRKTLRGGANFVVCSPEVANILEFTSGFRAKVSHDEDRGEIGAVNVGSLSKKFDIYVDPYFLRNVLLVGRKGNSFLESGFVYAPYVPLQVTPTIFGTDDFIPRKGVMTRYAKKMVRPDMYGLVVVRDLIG
jgi:hypothetical protein